MPVRGSGPTVRTCCHRLQPRAQVRSISSPRRKGHRQLQPIRCSAAEPLEDTASVSLEDTASVCRLGTQLQLPCAAPRQLQVTRLPRCSPGPLRLPGGAGHLPHRPSAACARPRAGRPAVRASVSRNTGRWAWTRARRGAAVDSRFRMYLQPAACIYSRRRWARDPGPAAEAGPAPGPPRRRRLSPPLGVGGGGEGTRRLRANIAGHGPWRGRDPKPGRVRGGGSGRAGGRAGGPGDLGGLGDRRPGKWPVRASEGFKDGVLHVEALPDQPAAGQGRASLLLQCPEEAHGPPARERDSHNLRGLRQVQGRREKGTGCACVARAPRVSLPGSTLMGSVSNPSQLTILLKTGFLAYVIKFSREVPAALDECPPTAARHMESAKLKQRSSLVLRLGTSFHLNPLIKQVITFSGDSDGSGLSGKASAANWSPLSFVPHFIFKTLLVCRVLTNMPFFIPA